MSVRAYIHRRSWTSWKETGSSSGTTVQGLCAPWQGSSRHRPVGPWTHPRQSSSRGVRQIVFSGVSTILTTRR